MKICGKCKKEKPFNEFYKHAQMKGGFLSECKTCVKIRVNLRHHKLSEDPEWVESERVRHREKYHRLGYKEAQKEWDKKRPWSKSQKYKNLHRSMKCEKGFELHHWSYNDEHLEDVFKLSGLIDDGL